MGGAQAAVGERTAKRGRGEAEDVGPRRGLGAMANHCTREPPPAHPEERGVRGVRHGDVTWASGLAEVPTNGGDTQCAAAPGQWMVKTRI